MGISEDLKDIKSKLEELDKQGKVKEKKFKYPWGRKVGKSQRRKNFVTIILINENGTIDYKKYQIIDQTIMHDLIPRLATSGYVMFDKKGNPVIILPNWSVEPFSPMEHYQKSLINGSNTTGYRILMAKMQSEKIDAKKGMANWVKWVIVFIIVGGIIFALVSGGGGKT
jgi:hypothetical protein